MKKNYFKLVGTDIKGKIVERNYNGFEGLYLGEVMFGSQKGKKVQFKNDKNTLLFKYL